VGAEEPRKWRVAEKDKKRLNTEDTEEEAQRTQKRPKSSRLMESPCQRVVE